MSSITKFDSLLEAVPNSLVGVDTAGKIRFVNHQSELLFGFERDDLIGHHIGSLVPEPLWHVYLEHREVYFADPRSRAMRLDLEVIARGSDGAEFPVTVRLSGIDTGDVLLEFAAVGEVTAKKQAFEMAQRLTAIVENCDDAIIATTLAGIVTSWNPAAEKMYGYSSTEIIGRSIDILAPANRVGEINAILGRIRSGHTVKHFETIRVRKDGSAIRVSITVSPIPAGDGLVVGASSIAREMTGERKAFEASRARIVASHHPLFAAARDVTKPVQDQKENVEQHAREREQLVDFQQLQQLTVGRELRMTELKKENEFLRGLLPAGAAQSGEDQR